VEDLGGSEEGDEGSEVAFDVEGSEETSEDHFGLLAVAVALPVVPGEVGSGDADGGGTVEEGAEAPVDDGAGDVEVGQLQDAAQGGEDEAAEVDGGGEPIPGLDAERGQEADRGAGAVEAVARGKAGEEGGGAVGAAVREDGVPGAVRRQGADLGQGERDAAAPSPAAAMRSTASWA
jgi:hypothetical protein